MPKRRQPENDHSHERWLVSYADFVTLLFAFFVVMYSVSQVNENKYKTLSSTLMEAFSEESETFTQVAGTFSDMPETVNETSDSVDVTPEVLNDVAEKLNVIPKAIKPIQVGKPTVSIEASVVDTINSESGANKASDDPGGKFNKTADLPQLSDQFSDRFSDLIDDEIIQVNSNEYWLQISLNDSILFSSAKANPSLQAEVIFSDIAELLKDFNNPIQVEGFTDNQPIKSPKFDSNWELSAARAAAVVKVLSKNGVKPERLSATGYGQYQPITENETDEGRAKNRRVVLMIAREKMLRPRIDTLKAIDSAINSNVVDQESPYPEPSPQDVINQLSSDNPALGLDATLQALTQEQINNEQTILDENSPIKAIELDDGGLLFNNGRP